MKQAVIYRLRVIVGFAALLELGTAVAVLASPGFVTMLLLGVDVVGIGVVLGRCFAIALLALGIACWPERQSSVSGAALRAMLVYNALIALYLTFLGTAGHLAGLLLWPAAVLHALVAALLLWAWGER